MDDVIRQVNDYFSPTMEIYVIQHPDTALAKPERAGEDAPREFVLNMQKAWKHAIPVRNTGEFVGRVLAEYLTKKKKVRKLVVGAHGYANSRDKKPLPYGNFRLGNDYITNDEGGRKLIGQFRALAPVFTSDAKVYLFSCKVGRDTSLLRIISQALGNVEVHGYTNFVTATNWGPFGATTSDETDDDNQEIVCRSNGCVNLSSKDPKTGAYAKYDWGKPYEPLR